ncbi:MAG: FAD-dependent oxidoreductase [Myxococcota bacterium]|nr:FAD-dependent oxidoreductase [Myxococcota bacterium]
MAERDEKKGLSRRDFLAGSAAGAAALAALPTTGRADEQPTWDQEADVVVIGGGTGLLGAITAARNGADKVVVLEKRAGVGGNTAMSGGVAWVPNNHVMKEAGIEDSREQALVYLRKLRLEQADDEIIETFVERGPEMALFVEANTPIRWRISKVMGKAADYHPEWEGDIPYGRSIEPSVDALGMYGSHLIAGLAEGAKAAGVEVLTDTPAQRLITEEDSDGNKKVLGVVALHDGKEIRIRAKKGVLLSAGGFDWNFTMKRHFLRGMSPYPLGSPGNTGDGVRIAMQAGADLRNMNEAWGITVYKEEAEANQKKGYGPSLSGEVEKRAAGSIVVNRYGERFCNETADYDSTWRTYFSWENHGDLKQRNLPAFVIYDSKVRENATIAGRKAGEALPDWVVEKPSLNEIAEVFGIDAEQLALSVEEFNQQAQQGRDPRFARGQSSYDRFGQDDPASVLAPVEKPPFFAAEIAVGDVGTCGGPRVDQHARVLDPFGQPIQGLYASGNNAGVGSPGASYGGGGGTIGPALTFAYVAGEQLGRSG